MEMRMKQEITERNHAICSVFAAGGTGTSHY